MLFFTRSGEGTDSDADDVWPGVAAIPPANAPDPAN